MGKLVVTEFVSLDGVMEAPGGETTSSIRAGASTSTAAKRAIGSSCDETLDDRGAADRARDLRELRRRLAEPRGRVRRQVQHDAEVRRLLDTRASPEWNNTTVLTGDAVAEATNLKQQIEGDRPDARERSGSCTRCSSTTSSTSSA